ILTSAVTGQGVENLATRIVRELVPEEHDEPSLLAGAVPFTPRQLDLIAALGQPAKPGGPASHFAADGASRT
ncbi:MAG: hypothetical protein RLZZ111_2176, partial [Planctomycetota bacterium]